MFNDKDVTEFVKRIIDKEPNEEKAILLIQDFKENLQLTKMANKNSIEKVDKIIKYLLNNRELEALLNDEDISKAVNRKKLENRHYNNYHTTSSSSSCGGYDTNYSSSCGCSSTTTYSSRC